MALYPAAEDEEEDYYTLSNPVFAGERFAPGSEGAIAFDEPSAGGVRYPMAAPMTGGQVGQFGDVTPDLQRALDAMIARDRPKSDALYNAQMDRVNRNEIADAGGDPMAVQQAIRLQGLRKYQKLLADGASNSEAYRLAAPELTFNHPQALASAMNHTLASQGQIRLLPVPGGTAIVNPNGNVQSVIRERPAPVIPLPKDIPPPDVKQTQKNIQTEIDLAKKEFERLNTALEKAETPDEKSNLGRAALAARNRLDELMKESVVVSTNYPRPSLQAPPNIVKQNTPPPPAEDDSMVPVVSPDGVAGKVPRSKLDAAKKQGYKER